MEQVDLDTLLRDSDLVTINCPLKAETHHLIGERELALMKPTACLINTSRGAVVDQAALAKALQTGAIAGAGLDVFEEEPIAPDDPLIALENVILAPHATAWTEELVRDNGIGLPPDVHPDRVESLGLKLVHGFVRQLYGNIEFVRNGGTWVKITFTA